MKYLVLVCVVLTVVNGFDQDMLDKMKETLMNISKTCALEVGASEEDLKELAQIRLPSTHEGMCVLYCLSKHFGTQEQDGKLNQETGVEHLLPIKEVDEGLYNKMKSIVEMCTVEVSNDEDPCITAKHLMDCEMKKGKELGLDAVFA